MVRGERRGEKSLLPFIADRLNVQLGLDKGAVLSHANMRYTERARVCGWCGGFHWEAPKRNGVPSPPCLPLSLLSLFLSYTFRVFLSACIRVYLHPSPPLCSIRSWTLKVYISAPLKGRVANQSLKIIFLICKQIIVVMYHKIPWANVTVKREGWQSGFL